MAEITLEEAMKRLDEIVKILEKNEEPLEESIKLFQEGMDLSKLCNDKLTHFEKQVVEIIGSKESQD
ncbi:MAG: exodeoxyribonuclease VII small subunit [Beduini sp.]|uniref:exodeoxyribonuclease VII small subunit n=1 Tax=Beduini sp. TaxID=1922300 RepID=UPI0011C7FD96